MDDIRNCTGKPELIVPCDIYAPTGKVIKLGDQGGMEPWDQEGQRGQEEEEEEGWWSIIVDYNVPNLFF